MNITIHTGRLGADPELRKTNNGKSVVRTREVLQSIPCNVHGLSLLFAYVGTPDYRCDDIVRCKCAGVQ